MDLYGTIWFYWWIGESITHGTDPGFTDLFFWPEGKDIFAHTGNNFVDAVIAAPLQWLLGNPRYYKWWIAIVLFGNALAFRPLAADQIRSPWAVFAATAMFELNPYALFEITCGRPTQAMMWALPLALLALLRLERSWKITAAAGVLFALVGYTYWFYAFFLAFAALWLVGNEGVRRGRAFLAYLGRLAIAAAIALLLVSPSVFAMMRRASDGDVPGLRGERELFQLPNAVMNGVPTKLLGYVPWEAEGGVFFHHFAWGIGLLAWVLLGKGRRRWVGVLLMGLLLATGPLQTIGDRDVRMLHYLVLYNRLPFFDRLWFPYRALSICFIAASLGLGFVVKRLADIARYQLWPAQPVLIGLSTAMLGLNVFGQLREHTYPFVVRDVTLPGLYPWMARFGGAVLDLPAGINQPAIVHQTRHGLPLIGGMGESAEVFWPRAYRDRMKQNAELRHLVRLVRHPERERASTGFDLERFAGTGVGWVALHRDLVDSELNRFALAKTPEVREESVFQATRRLIDLLGEPAAAEGPLVVWRVGADVGPAPLALQPTDALLWTREWERPEPSEFESRLFERGRLPGP